MPKPKVVFDKYAIRTLKQELCKKSGLSISTKAECNVLADKISQKNKFRRDVISGGYISSSTLYRLFFKSDSHTLYKTTLDLLCNYVGYRGADHFQEYLMNTKNSLRKSGIDTNQSCNSLLFYSIEYKSKPALQNFFENLDNADNDFKWEIGISLFDELKKTTNDDFFYKNFAGNSFVREYLFELLHDPKFRLKNFEKAYSSYLKYTEKKDNLKNHQDVIFGNCALYRYYYLYSKNKQAHAIGNFLYKSNLLKAISSKDMYVFPIIRYFSYKLWNLELNARPKTEILLYANELIDIAEKLIKNANGIEKDIIIHTLMETALHSKEYSYISKIIKDKFKPYLISKSPKLIDLSLTQSLKYFQSDGILEERP